MTNPACSPPRRNAALWRYMDFAKFVSMLETSALHFARSDMFDDQFEGSYSRVDERLRRQWYAGIRDHQLAALSKWLRIWRRFTWANCWNLGTDESAALWGLYSPREGGVAIRSTLARLIAALVPGEEDEADVLRSRNILAPFLYKRREFAFETEVRALIQDAPLDPTRPVGDQLVEDLPSPEGIQVRVDPDRLIERIHISPFSPRWFVELVSAVAERYGLSAPVARSSLHGEPVF